MLTPTQIDILRALAKGAMIHRRDNDPNRSLSYLVLPGRGTSVVRRDTLDRLRTDRLVVEVGQAEAKNYARYEATERGLRAVNADRGKSDVPGRAAFHEAST